MLIPPCERGQFRLAGIQFKEVGTSQCIWNSQLLSLYCTNQGKSCVLKSNPGPRLLHCCCCVVRSQHWEVISLEFLNQVKLLPLYKWSFKSGVTSIVGFHSQATLVWGKKSASEVGPCPSIHFRFIDSLLWLHSIQVRKASTGNSLV